MPQLPKARTFDILEQAADQDLLIYDLRINKAYNLNETSKIVFNACNKQMSFDELKRQSKFTDDLIYFALNELAANDLLENYESRHFAGLSRREVIRRVGLASMIALPVIAGITAPPAAHAASTLLANNQSCRTDAECASGTCTSTRNFSLSCCVRTADGNSPSGPGEFFQRSTEIGCINDAQRFCCSGRAIFDSANAGTCTCTM